MQYYCKKVEMQANLTKGKEVNIGNLSKGLWVQSWIERTWSAESILCPHL
jgi:hypothetical protein